MTLGTTVSWRHYISGASAAVAIYTRKSSGTSELRYLSHDHLGSIDAITNSSAAVLVRTSFDAFGARRDAADWSGTPSSADWTQITNSSRRGFTFHEMLDNLNLTHMNGRVYDPIAGRFTSPDPIVQAPHLTQGFNHYAYVFNAPLTYIDPSGFQATDADQAPGDNRDSRPGCASRCGRGLGLTDIVVASDAQTRSPHTNSGLEALAARMSIRELAAVQAGSRATPAIMGQAVHTATARSLAQIYPGKYLYYPRAPFDFVYVPTGQVYELTTFGQAGSHAARGADLIFYTLPR